MNNVIRLYHGSQYVIDKPLPFYGKKNNDFGQGFYTTIDADIAREWSVNEKGAGLLNIYDLNIDGLSVIKLMLPEFSALEWLAALLQNRIFGSMSREKRYILNYFVPDYKKYDVIVSYRADDSYFRFANDFLNNTISLQQLSEAMYLGKLGIQYCLKSQIAFDSLVFVGCEKVNSLKWTRMRNMRDSQSRSDYSNMRMLNDVDNGLYIHDIIREKIKAGDSRLLTNVEESSYESPRL